MLTVHIDRCRAVALLRHYLCIPNPTHPLAFDTFLSHSKFKCINLGTLFSHFYCTICAFPTPRLLLHLTLFPLAETLNPQIETLRFLQPNLNQSQVDPDNF